MKIRPRAIALALVFGVAGLGLAGCATDSVTADANTLDGGSYNYADPYYSYDYDWWPYADFGSWGGRRHFFLGRHSFSGQSFGHHR